MLKLVLIDKLLDAVFNAEYCCLDVRIQIPKYSVWDIELLIVVNYTKIVNLISNKNSALLFF